MSSPSSFKNGHIVITAYHHLWWLPVLFILIFIHNLTPLPSGSYESILTWNPFLHLHLCIKSQAWLRILFTTLRSIFKEYFIVWLASVFKLYLNRRFIPFLLFLLLLSLILQLKNQIKRPSQNRIQLNKLFQLYLLKTEFSSCQLNLDESWHTLILYILVYISFINFLLPL